MLNTSFPSWPHFSQEEADIAAKVLLSNKVNYWTGQEGRLFEKEFAEFADTRFAIAVANGTLALDLALIGLGIGKGDEVIVTSRTFIASVSSIINVGATPVFADVDLNSQNITVDTILEVLTPKTKAIMCVHLAGMPCDMDPINELAEQHNCFVIEDCAQAHGAKYKGRPVGSLGHVAAWSFCQDKIMTTGGEGGMVTTNCEQLWKKMWSYKDHGKCYDAVYHTKHPDGFRWLHNSFGSNFRLTEIQSAIGRFQLTQMPSWTAKRRQYASQIISTLSTFNIIRVPNVLSDIEHAYYKLYAFVEPQKLKHSWSRDKIVKALNEMGVPCMQGSCSEVYLENAFDEKAYKPQQALKNAKVLGETSLMFLVHPSLTKDNIDQYCKAISNVLSQAVD
ncbi:DegT/DnrJ/EryC1/StrS family aminotransferase [Flocculibacter collagenilyticus]|uniref:DegT/DnrJ/EryC1/StrS family aminotransferase n=1 Tax=Flocculibacter collagenilyticus TaxID=2744479 RepID=UPI0018F78A94|nr:DegT/DnrJ/EryC1/StrS aminotransferase family protein [Flocculibacter collagenilyticus]